MNKTKKLFEDPGEERPMASLLLYNNNNTYKRRSKYKLKKSLKINIKMDAHNGNNNHDK